MKLFKPYVNLTKEITENDVEQYTLHSVINLPVGFRYQSTTQQEIETPDGEKKWMVTLNFKPNGASADNTMVQEFDTVLLEGPTNIRHKIGICVIATANTSLLQNPSSSETDVDYDNAGGDI